MKNNSSESGFALLMVVFILSLATIIVTAFSAETFSFIRSNRSLTDGLQAELASKSALSLALGVLEVPDDITLSAQPWQTLNNVPSIPIPGFNGEVRVYISDQNSKINLNSISTISPNAPFNNSNNNNTDPTPQDPVSDYWKGVLFSLFEEILGNTISQNSNNNNLPSDPNSPFNNLSLTPANLVAVIHDSIDQDSIAFQSPTFPGVGIESQSTKNYFLNRNLNSLDDLLSVPGVTRNLIAQIAPYIKTSSSLENKININTAPPQVLKALGMTDGELNGIIDKRSVAPITSDELQTLVQGSPNLTSSLVTNSNSYKVFIRAKTVAVTKWLEADCMVQTGFGKKIASVRNVRTL